MEIDVTFTPNELGKTSREGRVVVVIDVVRAATTMCTGLANGAAAFLPVRSVTAARRRARAIPAGQRLLGGERGGVPPAGFDLGNSPLDYTAERVAGQQIVFTTTNGTATLAAAEGALAVYTGALVNLEAVAQRLMQLNAPVTLAAAGANGRPVLDDLGCAGMIIQRLQALGVAVTLSDGAQVALTVARRYEGRTLEMLRESFSGRALLDVGLGDDLHHCAQLSVLDMLPRLEGDRVVA